MDSNSSSGFQVPCGHLSGLFTESGGFPGQRSDLCRRMFSPFHVDSWLWKSCYHSWTLDGHFWWVFEVKVLVAQSCLTLCDPMNCSPPGSSVPGISQARILEWVAISSSRGPSQPRDWTQVSYIAGRWFKKKFFLVPSEPPGKLLMSIYQLNFFHTEPTPKHSPFSMFLTSSGLLLPPSQTPFLDDMLWNSSKF